MEPTDESPPQPPPRNKSADAKKDKEPEKKSPTTISGGFIGLCKIAGNSGSAPCISVNMTFYYFFHNM